MRVLFMGTPDYATAILKGLIEDTMITVVGLVTQPDKPVGRKQVLTPPHAKAYALDAGEDFPILQPRTLKDESVQEELRALKPDFIVVAAYGQILPRAVLDIAPCINLHASLLPKYRGASPIQSSVLADDAFSGVTAMMMEEGLDTGDMLGFSYVKLDENTTSAGLFAELSDKATSLTLKTLKRFSSLSAIKQSNALTSYAPKIKKEHGEVNFKSKATMLERKFRTFHPWPGVYLPSKLKLISLTLKDKEALHVKEGEILSITKEGVEVACSQGSIVLKTVQPPSKKAMDASAYLLGQRLEVGDTLS